MQPRISLEDLDARLAAIPDLLREQLATPMPDLSSLTNVAHFDVVGVGASEGPARLLNSVLCDIGVSSRTLSLSGLHDPAVRTGAGLPGTARKESCLVIFSQGLSPNAQLALPAASAYSRAVVFTSVTERHRPDRARELWDFPGIVWCHGPVSEGGTLLRLMGPMVASLAGLRFAAELASQRNQRVPWQHALDRAPDAYQAALDLSTLGPAVPWGKDPAACLAIGSDVSVAAALMWKWQEALYVRLPPALDVLSFAHGPLQAYYDEPALFVILERVQSAVSADWDLWSRLRHVVHPERHQVISVPASQPGPLGLFEFDARFSAMMLSEMKARGIDPGRWPGQKRDAPLYSVCPETGVAPEQPPKLMDT